MNKKIRACAGKSERGKRKGGQRMDVKKFFEAVAAIIAAREGVKIEVKSIKKAAGSDQETGGNAKRHLEQLQV